MESNHHRAVIDQEFVGAGQKEGLEIWRIDHFKVTRIPEKFHGKINPLKIPFINIVRPVYPNIGLN